MKIYSCFLVIMLFIFNLANALEIDEKLTLRILDISASKKTVLINRGLEDGLIVGDHAKFFKTTGVIARGVIIKASPTRSIWSIYRLVDGDAIEKNIVLSLKISAPVKLTQDPSRAIKEEDSPSAGIGIEMAEGADDLPQDLSKNEQADLSNLTQESATETIDASGVDKSKLWQIFAYGTYNMMTTSVSEGETSSSGNTTNILGGVGIEKYFAETNSLMDRLSLHAFVEMSLSSSHDLENYDASSLMLGGAGLSLHFMNDPLSYGRIIPCLMVNGGMGTAATTYAETAASGGVYFYNAGAGIKYNMKSGFGVRAMGLYSARSETYRFEGAAVEQLTINQTGFGVILGISLRF